MRQRIILIGLLIIAFLLTMVRHWIRYVLIVPVALVAIFTLGTIIFPLYQEGPDFISFYKAQESKIFFVTKSSTSKIIIQNKLAKNELDGQKTIQYDLPKNLETSISLVASSQTGGENGFILLPEGTIIQLSPQSQISFLSQYPKVFVSKQQGEVTELVSNNYSSRQLILSGVTKQDGLKNPYQRDFEKAKIAAIGDQANKIFMQNVYLKAVNKGILDVLARLRPSTFQESLKNFALFETVLPTQTIRQTDTTIDPKIQQDVLTQAGRGLEETQIYKRWKSIFR